MSWIESHSDMADHPKTLDLMGMMAWDLDTALGKIHRFLWWVQKYAEDGDLRKHNDDRLGRSVGMAGGEASSRFVEAMVSAGWIEKDPYMRVRNWWDYAKYYLMAKHKRHPEVWKMVRNSYITGAVTVTATDNLTIPNHTKPNTVKRSVPPENNTRRENNTVKGETGGVKPPEKSIVTMGTGGKGNGSGDHGPGGRADKGGGYAVTTDVQRVVLGFKVSMGVEQEDRAWDRVYFPRYSKVARDLLHILDGNADRCLDCIESVTQWLDGRRLSWTPETILKHAVTWKTGRLSHAK